MSSVKEEPLDHMSDVPDGAVVVDDHNNVNGNAPTGTSTEIKQEPVLKEEDIFDQNNNVKYSSDEDDGQSDSDSDSESSSDSDSDSDSSSDSGSAAGSNNSDGGEALSDDEGPIRSKHEIVDEVAPEIPEDFTIGPSVPIQYLGRVTGTVENSVLIQGSSTAEYQVLREGAILCREDRSPLGKLFEVFGRLQAPVYRLRFNTTEKLEKSKLIKGAEVYYVVPSAEFEKTASIKAMKGSDASNWNDEEIPEAEQEFSDDEKEREAKKARKRKRKQREGTASTAPKAKKLIPEYMKSSLMSLPPAGKAQSSRSTQVSQPYPPHQSRQSPPPPQEELSYSRPSDRGYGQPRQYEPPRQDYDRSGYYGHPNNYGPPPNYGQPPPDYREPTNYGQPNYGQPYPQQYGQAQNQTYSQQYTQPPSQHYSQPPPNTQQPYNFSGQINQLQALAASMGPNPSQANANMLAQITMLIASQAQSTANNLQTALHQMAPTSPPLLTQSTQPSPSSNTQQKDEDNDDSYDPANPGF